MIFKVLNSETLFKGKVFDVRRDQMETPNERRILLDIVEHNPGVTILPLDQQANIWFIRQYRHPVGKYLLELPAGVMEAGESATSSAQRELREEIGMAAGTLQEMGGFYLAPGYSSEYMHLFLATELYHAPLEGDEDEFLKVEKINLNEALELAHLGEIQDAKSLVGLFLLSQRFDQANYSKTDNGE